MRRRISRCGLEKRRVCVTMQHLAGLPGRVEHPLRVGQVERHRDLDLHVLALRQRQQRLVAMLVAGRGQNHGVHARAIDARLEIGRVERNVPLRGELVHTIGRAARHRHHFHALDLRQGLDVNLAHRPRACQTDFHRASAFRSKPQTSSGRPNGHSPVRLERASTNRCPQASALPEALSVRLSSSRAASGCPPAASAAAPASARCAAPSPRAAHRPACGP